MTAAKPPLKNAASPPRGRHFFFGPGPTNIPDSVLAAMHHTTMDFHAPDFLEIQARVHDGIKRMLRTKQHMLMYAGNGHAAWEAALVNCFSPGETLLVLDCGHFASNWGQMARDLGYTVETLTADWRKGVAAADLQARLKADTAGTIKGVLAVHNETATGVVQPLQAFRQAIDKVGHKALLLADAISSFGSIDLPMDDWGVDIVVAGSQKGLMMVTGMSLTGISDRAWARSETVKTPRSYMDWRPMRSMQPQRFPGTAPIHFYLGLAESVRLIEAEGFGAVLARHKRLAAATRAAVTAWGGGAKSGATISGKGISGKIGALEVLCSDAARVSDSVTTVLVPDGHDGDALRALAQQRLNLSLGGGLGPLGKRAFRIGHLGELNEPMLLGAIATTELALAESGIPFKPGVSAAIESLREAR